MNEQIILALVEKFSAGNLGELDIVQGDLPIQLRSEAVAMSLAATRPSGPESVSAPNYSATVPSVEGAASPALPPASASGPPSGLPVAGQTALPAGIENILSPIVATFYASPNPEAPPFVSPGSKVKAGDTLCILEAMKMMNHLEAEFSGEIIAVKVENGGLVEYGQPLFEIRRT